jgi:imidazolonepropionase
LAQLLLLRGAKQLLTLRAPGGVRRGAALQSLGIIEDGSVLIRDGIIAHVGPTRRLENLAEAKNAVVLPVNGSVVMPGFVDPFLQLTLYGHGPTPKRKKLADFRNETLSLLRSCLQHGTLNTQAHAFSRGGTVESELSVLRQLARIGNNPVGLVSCWRLGAPFPESAADGEQLAKRLAFLKRQKLADSVELAPPSNRVSDQHFHAALHPSKLAFNLILERESADVLRELSSRTPPRAVFCCTELDTAECALLASSPSIAVFSPSRDLLEDRSRSFAWELAEAGGAIALASGYDSKEAPAFSMQMALTLAVLRLRLTVEQAITAATINAAYAIGRGHEIGSLEVGKRADLLVLNLSDYREIPRRFGINHVKMVVRDGNLVLNTSRSKATAV